MKPQITVVGLGTRGMPRVLGGAENYCEQLLPRLAARDASVRFVLLARKGYVEADRATHKGVEVIALWAPKHKYFEAFVHTLISAFYARFVLKARAVHIQAIGPGLIAPIAKLLGMQVIVTHHSRNYLHANWNGFARKALRFGEWCAVTFADAVIAVSPSMAAELRARFPARAAKVFHVPNGATEFPTAERDASALLARFGVERDKYAIAVGRFVPEKGFHDLIPAFKQANTDLKLLIVGRADHADDYSRALEAQASENVIFAGFVDHATLGPLYRNAGLFVLSSHHEGMPLSVLEAVSQGAPVLLSDIEACTDLGLPAQNYFKVGDIADLAGKLRADPKTYRVAAETFLRKYRWDEVADETARIYASVLQDRFESVTARA
ncbi:MAG: glycosyltransferase family 4 protein [Hyphomonadaceae bacterium]|nr:glycosyltransferase family 4 protein [Hyphomonadaceae bacterium]